MYTYPMMIHNARKLVVAVGLRWRPPWASPALRAQTPPPPEQRLPAELAKLRTELFRALKEATTEQDARAVEGQIWLFWTHGPDDEATQQMADILAARRAGDNEKALQLANALTARLPDYAEGWNQKATVLFLMEDYDGSLEAIERVLALEPKHFGALSGKGMILMQQGRTELAQAALRAAVEIYPFLRARAMLIEPPGQPI